MIGEELKDFVPDWKDIKFTPKEKLFIYHYCIDTGWSAMEAYKKAGYSSNIPKESIGQLAGKILRKPKIKEGIKRYLNEYLNIQKDKLEAELFDMFYVQATYLPSDIIDTNGQLKKPIDQLSRQEQWCIKKIENKFYGKNAEMKSQTVELIDRNWALDKLSKYIEMMKQETTTININISKETDEKLSNIFNEEGIKHAL